MHILQYLNEEQFVKMRTNIEGGTLCNDYEMRTTSECEVKKLMNHLFIGFEIQEKQQN